MKSRNTARVKYLVQAQPPKGCVFVLLSVLTSSWRIRCQKGNCGVRGQTCLFSVAFDVC